jgi:hypothetical protein
VTLGSDPNKWISWDIKDDVKAFVEDGVPNYGWLIKDRNEEISGTYRTDWVSKDSPLPAPPQQQPCGNPSAPKLEVNGVTYPAEPAKMADAWLDENSPNTNRGSTSLLLVTSASPKSNTRMVVRFDLSTIPIGTKINTATLSLCLDKISGDSSTRIYEAHRLAMDWVEAEVTTNRAKVRQPWDFGAFDSPVPLAYVQKDVLTNDPNQYIRWDVTAHMRAGLPIHGWLIKDRKEEQSGTYKTEWISKEGALAGSTVCGPDSAPKLVVETSAGPFTFTLPEADASLDENSPNAPHGTETLLQLISSSPTSNWRTVVRFNLSGLSGPISTATLKLCLDKISGDQSRSVFEAYRLTMHWEELQVTTNQAVAVQPWDFGAF